MTCLSRRVTVLVFLIVLSEGVFTSAFACSCAGTSPPCEAFWHADLVFSGHVDKVEHIEVAASEGYNRVTFTVDRVLRGPTASQITIKTSSSDASCGYRFDEGDSYVVYGSGEGDNVSTSLCTRTRRLSNGSEDFDYAASLARPGAGGLIYGQVRRWDEYLGRGPTTRDLGSMANALIVAQSSAGRREARSREDGTFQIAGLEPGSFGLSLELPDTFTYIGPTEPVRLANEHACGDATFVVHFDGRIVGSVVDAKGSPVIGANVVLALAELADTAVGLRYNRAAVTDNGGKFELRTVPPGQYVLGLNIAPRFDNMILCGAEGQWIWRVSSSDRANRRMLHRTLTGEKGAAASLWRSHRASDHRGGIGQMADR